MMTVRFLSILADMKISTLLVLLLFLSSRVSGQEEEETFFSRATLNDTTQTIQDAIYNRPFITMGQTNTSIGGYFEGNTNYLVEDGIAEGFSMELRRFNIFLYSTIIPRVRFISELEFEHGTEEISLETALLDFEINPALVLRGGIILVPIGRFNQNHDAPQWEIIDRPLVSTQIIPSTYSDVGFGANGKFFANPLIFTYDVYLVNGLSSGVVANATGRTDLQSGKSPELFAEDRNKSPAFTGRLGVRHRNFGEIGFSAYSGAYNVFRIDGMDISGKRNLTIVAGDYLWQGSRLTLQGEVAFTNVQAAPDQSEQFGEKQWGGFLDIVYTILKRRMIGWDKAALNSTIRLEKVDLNEGQFSNESGLIQDTQIYDDITALVFGLGFRPGAGTILRVNYRYHWTRDFLGNPTIKSANFQVGFASYF